MFRSKNSFSKIGKVVATMRRCILKSAICFNAFLVPQAVFAGQASGNYQLE